MFDNKLKRSINHLQERITSLRLSMQRLNSAARDLEQAVNAMLESQEQARSAARSAEYRKWKFQPLKREANG